MRCIFFQMGWMLVGILSTISLIHIKRKYSQRNEWLVESANSTWILATHAPWLVSPFLRHHHTVYLFFFTMFTQYLLRLVFSPYRLWLRFIYQTIDNTKYAHHTCTQNLARSKCFKMKHANFNELSGVLQEAFIISNDYATISHICDQMEALCYIMPHSIYTTTCNEIDDSDKEIVCTLQQR